MTYYFSWSCALAVGDCPDLLVSFTTVTNDSLSWLVTTNVACSPSHQRRLCFCSPCIFTFWDQDCRSNSYLRCLSCGRKEESKTVGGNKHNGPSCHTSLIKARPWLWGLPISCQGKLGWHSKSFKERLNKIRRYMYTHKQRKEILYV